MMLLKGSGRICFLFLITLQCFGSLHPGFSQLQYGHRLDGSIINSFPEISFLDCVTECLVTPRCVSVNYCNGAMFCEINYGDIMTPFTKISDISGWIYSEMTQWPKVILVQYSHDSLICATLNFKFLICCNSLCNPVICSVFQKNTFSYTSISLK